MVEHQITLMNLLLILQIQIKWFLTLQDCQILMIECFTMVGQKLNQFIRKVLLDFITNLHFGYLRKFLYFAVPHQMEMLLQMQLLLQIRMFLQKMMLLELRSYSMVMQMKMLLGCFEIGLHLLQRDLLCFLDLVLHQILMIDYFIQT